MNKVKYVDLKTLDLKGERYQVWQNKGKLSTIRIGTTSYKTLANWESEEVAKECLEIWRGQDWTGSPSTPASFFHQFYYGRRGLSWSQNLHFVKQFRGGWQKTFVKGLVPEESYLYDIKSAYYWAGDMLLPTGYKLYERGDTQYIVLMYQKYCRLDLPTAFMHDGLIIADHYDVAQYNLEGEVLFGLSWNDKHAVRLDTAWNELDKLGLPPKVAKKVRSAYWGRWCMSGGVLRNTIDNGEVKSENIIRNHLLNMVWSNLITHKVMRKMHQASRDNSLLIMTDAVLKTIKMNTGENAGDFVLKNTFENGVYIESSGVWTRAPAEPKRNLWTKHAGIKNEVIL